MPVQSAAAPLQFSVTTDVSQPGTWSYTAHNDEPPGSPLFISSFLVVLNGPILVFGSPDGWTTETDYISYVLWFNLDTALPYPHDIAPGESLGGFFIQSPSPRQRSVGRSGRALGSRVRMSLARYLTT